MRTFTAIQVFNRVAELKGFAQAARDLGMSTSSVSRHVKDLEDDLGVRLFNRTTRRLSLTQAGQVYQQRSAEILEDLEELHSETRDQDKKASGRLRVTVSQALGESWVVQLLPKFIEQYPDVCIELDISDRLVDLVEEGFDVGVRTGELKESTMIARKLMNMNYIAVASPDYCKKYGVPEHPDDLRDHKCIEFLQPNHQSDDWWFEIDGEEVEFNVDGIIAVNNAWAARDLACAGVGITYIQDFVVKHDIENNLLRRVMPDFDNIMDPVHAIYPSKRLLSTKVRVFVDFLVSSSDIPYDIGASQL